MLLHRNAAQRTGLRGRRSWRFRFVWTDRWWASEADEVGVKPGVQTACLTDANPERFLLGHDHKCTNYLLAYDHSMTRDDDLLSLDAQLCFAMVTAARNVVSMYRPILEPLGLTHPQYLVMLALWEESPRALNELADALAMEPATASPLVKRLEKQGLVRRERSPQDERRLQIAVTEAGAELRAQATVVPHQVMAAADMNLDEVVALREALRPFAGGRP